MNRRFLFPLLCCLLAGSAWAAENDLDGALARAASLELHESEQWHSLLLYQSSVFGRLRSEIRSPESLLAEHGRRDSQAELEHTIRAFFRPAEEGQENEHARCRFIARYEYLKTQLALPDSIEQINCSHFKAWLDIEQIESASLVFASGYFRNPASFFGHPVLKFNRAGAGSSLLDLSLNNGAVVPDNENPIVYVLKGVFGGYESAFSDTRYYQLNHSYAESDLRDLWHYELNLSKQELARLIYFSWELLGHKFTYQFFSKNCGYFLEELFSYALGERISPVNRFYSVPATTFINLVKTDQGGSSLVRRIHREPSRQSRFREKYLALSEDERAQVKGHVKGAQIENLETPSQLRVIDTLVDYYSFVQVRAKQQTEKQALAVTKTKLFAKRLSLTKTDDAVWPQQLSSQPPHVGNPPTLLRMSALHSSEFGGGLKLRLRPASYDLLDLEGAHARDSRLNMFNTEVGLIDDKLRLLRFDLVDVETLNLTDSGLPGDGGLGWGLKIGIERASLDCLNCQIAHVSGSIRKGRRLSDRWTAYAHGEATYHSSFEGSNGRARTALGLIGELTPTWKSHLRLGRQFQMGAEQSQNTMIQWDNRFGTAENWNGTVSFAYDGTSEVSVGIGRYW